MKSEDKAEIARINKSIEGDRAMKRKLVESEWHFLVFKGEHSPLHMRCPDRQHPVQLTPAQALTEGCPVCAKMDGPTQTVSLARLKKDVDRQEAAHLKSLRKTTAKMRGRGGAPTYYTTA